MRLTGGPDSPDNAIVVGGDSTGTVIADNTATSGLATLALGSSGVQVLRQDAPRERA